VVYAVGGDGTVHETAKRLIGRDIALGVVPAGSGNGFARQLGLPMNLRASMQSCRGGRIVTVDTARVNGMPFLATMGVGFGGTIDKSKHWTVVQGKRVETHRPSAGAAHLDGEPVSLPARLSVEIVPRSLRVLVPDTMEGI